jgi:hypothetical protein
MFHPTPSSASQTPPAHVAQVKPGFFQDIGWGRPVFRAPELPAPRVFASLPHPSHFSGGQRMAAGR